MDIKASIPLLAAAALGLSSLAALSQTAPPSQGIQSSNQNGGTNAPPVCNDGGPYDNVECAGAPTSIPVDSSASFDPDGTAVAFQWFEECPNGYFEDPTSPQTNFVIDMTGVCQRSCVYVVRVTSGGQTTVCHGTAVVRDTTAPVMLDPADVAQVWGADTSLAACGFATAFDACDPSPLVSYVDVITPQPGPGIEQVITRTWTAMDACGGQATCDQVITLLSPSMGAGNLELEGNSCPHVFQVVSSQTQFRPILIGTSRALVGRVDLASLKLSRPNRDGYVMPILPGRIEFQDVIRGGARRLGDCNSPGQDGQNDFVMSFDRAQVISALGLDQVLPGTSVTLTLSGTFKTGGTFWSTDQMIVQ